MLTQYFMILFSVFSINALHISFWDNNLTETSSFSTLTFKLANVTQLRQAKTNGLSNLYYAFWFFYDPLPTGYVLRDDWQHRWATIESDVSAMYHDGTIEGFFLGDELVYNGLNLSSLAFVSNFLRERYTNATIWYNEAQPPVTTGKDRFGVVHNYSVPASLSWLSVDKYHEDGANKSWVELVVKPFYDNYVFPRLAPNQSVAIVPGAFSSDNNPGCNRSCYDTMCATDATSFYNWARCSARTICFSIAELVLLPSAPLLPLNTCDSPCMFSLCSE
eukprot:m.35534 g.35534  ORF g.35534 m.35534 type:complete len:276 (+) comp12400_c0_seq3:58-885(+)